MPKLNLLINIILSILISYSLTFILHGYTHTIISYFYGVNSEPWILPYTSYWLQNVTENAEFAMLDRQASYFTVGVIGFSGYLMNWALICLAMARLYSLQVKISLVSLWYWLLVWNLSTVFSYIPQHLLEVTNVSASFHKLGISIWVIYVIGGIAGLCLAFVVAYSLMQEVLAKLSITSLLWRKIYFTISMVSILFYNNIHYVFVAEPLSVILNVFFILKLIIFALICYTVKLTPKR